MGVADGVLKGISAAAMIQRMLDNREALARQKWLDERNSRIQDIQQRMLLNDRAQPVASDGSVLGTVSTEIPTYAQGVGTPTVTAPTAEGGMPEVTAGAPQSWTTTAMQQMLSGRMPNDPGRTVDWGGQKFELHPRERLQQQAEEHARRITEAEVNARNSGTLRLQDEMLSRFGIPVTDPNTGQSVRVMPGMADDAARGFAATYTAKNPKPSEGDKKRELAKQIEPGLYQDIEAATTDAGERRRLKAAVSARLRAGDPEGASGVLTAWAAGKQREGISINLAGVRDSLGSDDGVVELTAEGLDAAALNYARTGQLPPMGMGKASGRVRTQIINRAAEVYPNLDVSANSAEYAANKRSLAELQRSLDAVESFEKTAKTNLQTFLNTAKGVIDTGSPLINKPLRAIDNRMLGGTSVPAFDAARRVAINEIAKITSNPNLTGQLSDSARHEIESFIPQDATLKQIYSVAKVLISDMEARPRNLKEQIAGIKQRIGSSVKGGTDKPGAAQPTGVEKWDFDSSGKLVRVSGGK